MSLEDRVDVGAEYEGCRRGMRGLGGAGARGYLVNFRDDAGDVGDLILATVSAGARKVSAT